MESPFHGLRFTRRNRSAIRKPPFHHTKKSLFRFLSLLVQACPKQQFLSLVVAFLNAAVPSALLTLKLETTRCCAPVRCFGWAASKCPIGWPAMYAQPCTILSKPAAPFAVLTAFSCPSAKRAPYRARDQRSLSDRYCPSIFKLKWPAYPSKSGYAGRFFHNQARVKKFCAPVSRTRSRIASRSSQSSPHSLRCSKSDAPEKVYRFSSPLGCAICSRVHAIASPTARSRG